MIQCPSCGQALPPRAKYCARCGRPLATTPGWSATPTSAPPSPGMWALSGPRPQRVPGRSARTGSPLWLLLLLYLGALVPLVLGLVYTLAAAVPGLANTPGSGYSDADVQRTAMVLAVSLFVLLAAQVVAAVGLTLRRAWGRIVATIVCAAWMLTVLAIPVSILALTALWRRAEP